jgi:glycosyltransferase involved in cell wall biosynthesis
MSVSPKISICIPTYNGEVYLRECIDSCLNQTFSDYEIVICDDGSSDTTVEIIESYLASSNKIKFYKNEKNLGLVGNWNTCIEKASGEWIKFVFQDDYILTDCLQEFSEQIGPDIKLITSKRNFILPENISDKDRNYYNQSVRTLENTGYYTINHFSQKIISILAVENICMNFIAEPSLVMFKKDVIKLLGDFDAEFKQICDLEFLQRVATNYGLQYLPKKNCFFRIHQQSTTVKNVSKNTYYLQHVEPVLLAHKMLYSHVYDSFRKSLSFSQLYRLKTYFKVRTFESYLNSIHTTDDKELFESICNKYPEIKKASEGSSITKLKYFILKQVRKIK